MLGDEGIECAYAGNILTIGRRIGNLAPGKGVVTDQQSARTQQREPEFDVPGVVRFVGIEEEDVVWLGINRNGPLEQVDGVSCVNGDRIGKTCLGNLLASEFGMERIDFERVDVAILVQGASHYNGAVPGERSDFKDALCTDGADEECEDRTLLRCDRNGRNPGCLGGAPQPGEQFVLSSERCQHVVDKIVVQWCPFDRSSPV